MSRNKPVKFDENPEWTKADFAKAKRPEDALSAATLKNFRGPQKTPKKVPVSIRLDEIVIQYFKQIGPGWQSKINDLLVKVASQQGSVTVESHGRDGKYEVQTFAKSPGRRTITKTKKRA